jgi:S-DNA-T family DNA segregation ATPase FtsK/SpoIIIE
VIGTVLLVLLGLIALWMLAAGLVQGRNPVWWWYLAGYPLTLFRMVWTWRRLCVQVGLTGDRRGGRVMLGGLSVEGQTLRPVIPVLRAGRALRDGLCARVRLLPGQVPAEFARQSVAIMHAWRVHSVRVSSPERGWVQIRAYAFDPLAGVVERDPGGAPSDPPRPGMVLRLLIGLREDAAVWVMNLRALPHWMIVGATQTGKSTLIHAVVTAVAPLPVALVGIDLKGGLELSVYGPRLSGLAINLKEAADLLEEVLNLAFARMQACRIAGVQCVWKLKRIPPPVLVIVDEVAEIYLTSGSAERQLRDRASGALLRLAQLGAALDIHLLVSGQRIGSDTGPGVTTLRAQLSGRVCHRVNDEETAVMCLGDLFPEAVAAALLLTPTDRGVAVTTDGAGGWVCAKSVLTSSEEAAEIARAHAAMAPALPGIAPPDFSGGGDAL